MTTHCPVCDRDTLDTGMGQDGCDCAVEQEREEIERAMDADRYRVVRITIACNAHLGWEQRVGQIGTLVELCPSVWKREHDGLRLRFDDGEVRMFARDEVEEVPTQTVE